MIGVWPQTAQKRLILCLWCFGVQVADSICKYGSKGQKIAIAGMLRIEQYEKEGQKRTRATVWVDQWEFCEPKRDTAPAGPDAAARYNAAVAAAEQLTPVTPEDELPF